jgi:hypothetical protein
VVDGQNVATLEDELGLSGIAAGRSWSIVTTRRYAPVMVLGYG